MIYSLLLRLLSSEGGLRPFPSGRCVLNPQPESTREHVTDLSLACILRSIAGTPRSSYLVSVEIGLVDGSCLPGKAAFKRYRDSSATSCEEWYPNVHALANSCL